jgi:ribosome recycling factor
MSADDVMLEIEEGMEKALAHLTREYRMIRTGRATPALVENIKVHAYGTDMTLKQCGTISVPEARQLMIKPFDPNIIKDIEKALLASELGVTPQNDGKLLRLVFPPLTEERRKQLAQEVKSKGEDAKVVVRNVRRDGLKQLEGLKKSKDITEDDLKRFKDDVQELVKQYEGKADEEVEKKTKEIMEI